MKGRSGVVFTLKTVGMIFVVISLMGAVVHADTIAGNSWATDFKNGYANGALSDNDAWGGNSGFTVDVSDTGTVSVPNSGGEAVCWKYLANDADVYRYAVNISFQTNTAVQSGWQTAFSFKVNDAVSTWNQDKVTLNLQRNGDQYRLYIFHNGGSGGQLSSAVSFSSLSGSGRGTDTLTLKLELVPGATDWMARFSLAKQGGEEPLIYGEKSFTPLAAFSSAAAFQLKVDDLFTAAELTEFKLHDLYMDKFHNSWSADFKTGYQNGLLTDNINWGGNSGFVVDTNGSGTATLPEGGGNVACQTYLSSDADVYRYSVDFAFQTNAWTETNFKTAFTLSASDAVSSWSTERLTLDLQRNADMYRLYLFHSGGSGGQLAAAVNFADMSSGGGWSQTLTLSLELEAGESDWIARFSLTNKTEGVLLTSAEKVFAPGAAFAAASALQLKMSALNSDAGLDSFAVYSVDLQKSMGASPQLTGLEAFLADYNLSDPSLDSDYDGRSNLEEYAFGGNPTNPAVSGYPPVLGYNDGWFSMVQPVVADTNAGITVWVEICDDLNVGAWTNAGVEVFSGASSNSAFTAMTNRIQMADKPAGFLRTRVMVD